jgi:hypothetical protein
MKTKSLCVIVAVLAFLAAMTSACNSRSPFVSPTQSPLNTAPALAVNDIEKAVAIGKAGCNSFRSIQDEEPDSIDARLLPLSEADRLMNEPGSIPSYNLPNDTPVWVVQMQGKWHTEGGPVPTRRPDEAIVYYTYCGVMINAETGYVMGYRLRQTEE